MPRLFQPPYTKPIPEGTEIVTHKGKPHARFKDKRGKTVQAPLTEDGQRIRLLSRKWYGEYRDADDNLQTVPLSTDKTAAGQMLAALVHKAEMKKANCSDPFEAHRKRPLTEHLEDFKRSLLAKGSGKKHSRDAAARVQRIIDGCGCVFIDDISLSRVQEFLAELRQTRRSLPALDPGKEWYKKTELAAAVGVKPHCITPLVSRGSCRPRARARRGGSPAKQPRRCGSDSTEDGGQRQSITTSVRHVPSRAGWSATAAPLPILSPACLASTPRPTSAMLAAPFRPKNSGASSRPPRVARRGSANYRAWTVTSFT
jgi:hypothetical protein